MQLLGAIAGYAFSEGDAANVSLAASIAVSGFQNNYLTHKQLADIKAAEEACGEDEACKQRVRDAARALSAAQDLQFAADWTACKTGSADACGRMQKQIAYINGLTVDSVIEDIRSIHPDYSDAQLQGAAEAYLNEFRDSYAQAGMRATFGTLDAIGAITAAPDAAGIGILKGLSKLFKGSASTEAQQLAKQIDEIVDGLDGTTKGVPDVPEGVPYYRVQGGGSGGATSRDALTVNPDGTVSITPGCTGSICVSVEGPDHAAYYLSNKRPDGSVVVFEVDRKTHNQIMEDMVPQRGNSGAGVKETDVNTPGLSIELNQAYSELMTSGSSNGRVLTQQEFLDEFSPN